ncbi:T9SS C-terminal target domain-containing protein, partial [candidate division KSB1 bacterium]
DAFKSRYGREPFGQYDGRLDNSGEKLALVSDAGDTLINIRYNDKYPWPQSADGGGYSMVPTNVNPFLEPADGRHWTASSVVHGTPGGDDLLATRMADEEKRLSRPDHFELYQNYPNPFNPSTTIRFSLAENALVTLSIYNIIGQRVATLLQHDLTTGTHAIQWHAASFAAGVYLCRLETAGLTVTKKMVLVK